MTCQLSCIESFGGRFFLLYDHAQRAIKEAPRLVAFGLRLFLVSILDCGCCSTPGEMLLFHVLFEAFLDFQLGIRRRSPVYLHLQLESGCCSGVA